MRRHFRALAQRNAGAARLERLTDELPDWLGPCNVADAHEGITGREPVSGGLMSGCGRSISGLDACGCVSTSGRRYAVGLLLEIDLASSLVPTCNLAGIEIKRRILETVLLVVIR